ncbi:MAG: sterol desaturase family protein [Polyangiaceae bacterium]
MHVNLIAAAVPVFFAAIVVEVLVDRSRKERSYRFGTAVADLEAGIASQVGDVFLRGLGILIYAWVYRYRQFEFAEGSPWPWVIGLIGIDFLYYWWHRASHVVNVLWAVHAVHHQSEDFNLAVALRQPAFETLSIIPFHLPLALLGIDPWIYASCYAIDLIYQFWIHTELAGKLGVVEYVLNTPSAHRVHHGINPQYLDKNYGGILVVWDRLFGTYEPEGVRPTYGVTHALRSYNPVWANLSPFYDIAVRARQERRLIDKLRLWFAHPARLAPPNGVASPIAKTESAPAGVVREKYDPAPSSRIVFYVFAHFVLLTAAGGAFMKLAETATLATLALPGAMILASAVALTAWIERRSWALGFDIARQIALVVAAGAYVMTFANPLHALATAGALAFILATLFAALRPHAEKLSRVARL